ncbi:hypothetical protein V8F33_005418 [Rhypophila sp. PSN 637]
MIGRKSLCGDASDPAHLTMASRRVCQEPLTRYGLALILGSRSTGTPMDPWPVSQPLQPIPCQHPCWTYPTSHLFFRLARRPTSIGCDGILRLACGAPLPRYLRRWDAADTAQFSSSRIVDVCVEARPLTSHIPEHQEGFRAVTTLLLSGYRPSAPVLLLVPRLEDGGSSPRSLCTTLFNLSEQPVQYRYCGCWTLGTTFSN